MPRYLGSKFPLNNRALHTFSCIDRTARGNEWTVQQVTKNNTRVAVMGADRAGKSRRSPPWEKMFSLYVGTFYYFFELQANRSLQANSV